MERSITLAHQIEVMARQKKLEDLQYYLRPKSESGAAGAASWLAALRLFKAKQDAKAKTRV